MKIATKDLTGRALNWAVRQVVSTKTADYVEARDNFSTCWNKGGPIIERLMALGAEMRQGGPGAGNQRCWFKLDSQVLYSYGPTPLIAAMRCLVASKMGDEVDVPEELL